MNIEEAIKYIKNDIECDKDTRDWFNDKNNSTRKQIEESIDAYETLLTAYEKEKEKNKKYEELICRVRNLSNGVVSYDIINGKKYLGPRKNFSKQRLYEQFLNIKLILKGDYIFLSNEEYLEQLLKEE